MTFLEALTMRLLRCARNDIFGRRPRNNERVLLRALFCFALVDHRPARFFQFGSIS